MASDRHAPRQRVHGQGLPRHQRASLWATAATRGFRSGDWATYRQWRALGAQVRKGERGAVIVFYKTVQPVKEDQDDDNEKAGQSRLVACASWAFNADQVDGWTAPTPQPRSEVKTRKHVEAFIASTRADIRHGGDLACYDPVGDYIAVPHPAQFVATQTSSATEGYYSVILHELTHWTGAANRLSRTLQARFGDEAYAMEELVAEFGAAFLYADLGIANEPRLDHAAYVSSWLKVLSKDRTALFTAANKASVAATYLSDFAAPRA
jgi:antirestriction protein ArdC